MQLLAPDIMDEARHLTTGLLGVFFGVGVLLWWSGWRGHRFWIVLATTVGAGIVGLYSGRAHNLQPMVAGLLLAVAAGVLALALVRVLAFLAGGAATCLLVRAFLPHWNEPVIWFLVGGLCGLLLFRFWTMALTSMSGALLMGYSGLSLADRWGKLDAVGWTESRAAALNIVCIVGAALGLFIQVLQEHRRIRRQWEREEEQALAEIAKEQLDHRNRWRRAWWKWVDPRPFRRAG